MDAFLTIRWKN